MSLFLGGANLYSLKFHLCFFLQTLQMFEVTLNDIAVRETLDIKMHFSSHYNIFSSNMAHPLHTSKSYSTLHNYMYRHYLQLKNTCIHIFSKMVPQGATHQVSLKLRVEIIDIMLPGHSKIH